MAELDAFLSVYGLAAVFVLMLAKAVGVPIPIPSDAVMLLIAARAAEGKLALGEAFVVILVALVVGGFGQFMLLRGPGRSLVYRYGRRVGLSPARLDAAARRLQKGGWIGVGVAVLTPGVRAVAVPASAVACLSIRQFVAGLTAGSATFLGLHFGLGYAGGSLLVSLGRLPLPVLVAGLAVLLVAGVVVALLVRTRLKDGRRQGVTQALHALHDAACPVCLALSTVERLQTYVPPSRRVGEFPAVS